MIINFGCQFDWIKEYLETWSHILVECLWGCVQRGLVFEWGRSALSAYEHHPVGWGTWQNKKGRKKMIPPPPGHSLSPPFSPFSSLSSPGAGMLFFSCTWTSELQALQLVHTRTYISAPPPRSRAFGLRLRITPLAFLVLRLWDLDWARPLTSLGLQLAAGLSWDSQTL